MKRRAQRSSLIHLAATVGDATGIGPEVAAKALEGFLKKHTHCKVHLFAPKNCLDKNLTKWVRLGSLVVHDEETKKKYAPGKPGLASASRALTDLTKATDFCRSKRASALVTGPLDKYWCAKITRTFTGHTEFLQKRTKSKGTTMVLAGEEITVALVTTHLALKNVSAALTKKKIIQTTERLHAYLSNFRREPKIAVCALNPHASDNGLFGDEERRTIAPALSKLKKKGLQVSGPYSADSFFHRAGDFDAVVCMYHDQGLIPLKMKHFYDAINITLGLPFLRVSVDHGTAFDIAGKKKASYTSYAHALEHAYRWARNFSSAS